ncbi:MAG: tryptophan--tRNA ligase [Candidatus Dormibacteria bacterium]
MSQAPNRRILTGIKPTGRLHLGNYLGAVRNWVELQNQGYDCLVCVVDLHALTIEMDPAELRRLTRDMVLDLVAAGVDPERTTLFVQSHVPEVTELHWLLSSVVQMGKLQRVPTFKEEVRRHPDNVNYALLGYPVLQTADITVYDAGLVPVGEDQMPHLELGREVVRTFNARYGPGTLVEFQGLLTDTPRVPGLDGTEKMSKSAGNTIEVFLGESELQARVMTAVTDVERPRRADPGHPENCNVCRLHRFFSPDHEAIWAGERSASTGCADTKRLLAERLSETFRPMRERREQLAADPDYVDQVLAAGATRARSEARKVLARVRDRVGLLQGG